MQKIKLTEKGAFRLGFAGAVAWSFLGVFNKLCTADPLVILAVRGLVTALLMTIVRRTIKVHFTVGNLMGAVGIAVTGLLYIVSIKMTSAANAIALQYSMTAVVLLITVVRERRKPALSEILTVLGVLTGVILCTLPGRKGGGSVLGDALALLSAFSFALVFLAGRRSDADPLAYTYLGNLVTIPLFLLAADKTLLPLNAGLMVLMGVSNMAGYLCVGFAMRKLNPVSAAVVSNADPVLNPVWVYLFLGEFPGWLGFCGAALVLLTILVFQLTHASKQK